MGKKLVFLCMACLLLLGLALPCSARQPFHLEGEEPVPDAAITPQGTTPATLQPLLEQEELDALISAFIEENGIEPERFALAYLYTGTGEAWFFNGDSYFAAASLYKLPLVMALSEMVFEGTLSADDKVLGMPIAYIQTACLTYSKNDVAEALIQYFYPYKDYRNTLARVSGFREDELDEEYFESNVFTARFMLGTLQRLLGDSERFPNVIECLLPAQANHYLEYYLEDEFEIAQKYGSAEGFVHTAGIVYTPTPFLVVVMTDHVSYAEEKIGKVGRLLSEYTLFLDARAELLEAQAEAAGVLAEAEAQVRATEEADERVRAQAAEEEQRLAAAALNEMQAQSEAKEQAQLQAREEESRKIEQIRKEILVYLLGGTILIPVLLAVRKGLSSRRPR